MDIIRSHLDELMGKDRNITNEERAKKKEHYDDPDVCKYFLVSLCPHDLFPNTKQDLGVCTKRHDSHFKRQFDNDSNRMANEKRYISDTINLIEGLLSGIDTKIKRSKSKLENAVDDRIDQLPADIQKRVEAIDEEIKKYLAECQKLGSEGKLDDAVTIMEEVDKLKKRKEDLLKISENPNALNSKNMKVCEICGAMQTVVDTDKRVITHLEGKLHTGFAMLRKEFERLKEKKEELKKGIINQQQKKHEKKHSRSRSRDKKSKKKDRRRSRSHSSDRKKKKHHHKSKRERSRSKSDSGQRSRSEKKDKKQKKHSKKEKSNKKSDNKEESDKQKEINKAEQKFQQNGKEEAQKDTKQEIKKKD